MGGSLAGHVAYPARACRPAYSLGIISWHPISNLLMRRRLGSDLRCVRDRVSTFGFTAGSQLTTALSKGRGPGEAGGEGLFSSRKISESLTHRFAVAPLPRAGEGCCH
jgi:hypothetical protein